MTDANVLLKWLRYERIDGVPDEERRRQCADALTSLAAELEQCRRDVEAGRKLWAHLVDTRQPWGEDQYVYIEMGLLASVQMPEWDSSNDHEQCSDCPGDCDECFRVTDLLSDAALRESQP